MEQFSFAGCRHLSQICSPQAPPSHTTSPAGLDGVGGNADFCQLPMRLLYLCLSFSGKWKATNIHRSTLRACTGSSSSQKHCFNKGKLRNVPVEVACRAVWHLLCLYRWVGFNNFFQKIKAKKWTFSAVRNSEILVRRKKIRGFNTGVSTF